MPNQTYRPFLRRNARLGTRLCLTACLAVVLSALVFRIAWAGTETTGSPPVAHQMK